MKRTIGHIITLLSVFLFVGVLLLGVYVIVSRYLDPPRAITDVQTTQGIWTGKEYKNELDQALGLIPVGDDEKSYFDTEPFRLWGGFTIPARSSYDMDLGMIPYGVVPRALDARANLIYRDVTNHQEEPKLPGYYELVCVVTLAQSIDIVYGDRPVGNYVGSVCKGGEMYMHFFVMKSSYLLDPERVSIRERWTPMVKSFS